MDCIYIAVFWTMATQSTLQFVPRIHAFIHHARKQPARREQLGLGVLLRDPCNHPRLSITCTLTYCVYISLLLILCIYCLVCFCCFLAFVFQMFLLLSFILILIIIVLILIIFLRLRLLITLIVVLKSCAYCGVTRAVYLAGTLGAAVHNPVFLVLEQTAVLPAHVLLLRVLHPPQSVLHHRVLLGLWTTQNHAHFKSQLG